MKRYICGLLSCTVILSLFGCTGKKYDVILVPKGTDLLLRNHGTSTFDTTKVIAIKIDRETGQTWVITDFRVEYKVLTPISE